MVQMSKHLSPCWDSSVCKVVGGRGGGEGGVFGNVTLTSSAVPFALKMPSHMSSHLWQVCLKWD